MAVDLPIEDASSGLEEYSRVVTAAVGDRRDVMWLVARLEALPHRSCAVQARVRCHVECRSTTTYQLSGRAVSSESDSKGSEGLQFRPARRSTQQTHGIRSTLELARVAALTVEAERNVGSSPVCEAASEVRPRAAVLRPVLARHGQHQKRPRDALPTVVSRCGLTRVLMRTHSVRCASMWAVYSGTRLRRSLARTGVRGPVEAAAPGATSCWRPHC